MVSLETFFLFINSKLNLDLIHFDLSDLDIVRSESM